MWYFLNCVLPAIVLFWMIVGNAAILVYLLDWIYPQMFRKLKEIFEVD